MMADLAQIIVKHQNTVHKAQLDPQGHPRFSMYDQILPSLDRVDVSSFEMLKSQKFSTERRSGIYDDFHTGNKTVKRLLYRDLQEWAAVQGAEYVLVKNPSFHTRTLHDIDDYTEIEAGVILYAPKKE